MSNNPFKSTVALGIVRSWNEFSGPDFLKSDNSGNWSQNGAPADPGPYLPVNYRHVFQRWHDRRFETIDTDPLPDLAELNKAVPPEEWEPGYNGGQPRPPWHHCKQIIIINLRTGAQVIFSASSIRAILAVTRLIDQINSKNFMFGRTAAPVVELGSAPFNTTNWGLQRRGDFKVSNRWVDLNGNQTLSGLTLLSEPNPAEELLNDELPDFAKDEAPFDDPIDDLIDDRPSAKPAPLIRRYKPTAARRK